MDKQIYELLIQGTLYSQRNLISLLINRSESKQSNSSYHSIFQQFLIELKVSVATPFMMVGPKRGLSCYVAEFLSNYVTVRDYEKQTELLKSLLQDLDELHESKRAILKMTTAQNLLQITEHFGVNRLLARNTNGVPIRFYFVPYGNRSINAAYFPHLHLVVIYKNDLDSNSNPEYIFMHELGHVVQVRMTKGLTNVPNSFKEAVRGMFKPCSEEVLAEVFADCFSVAVMKGTSFEEKNPLCVTFLQEHQTLLRDYFSSISKVK